MLMLQKFVVQILVQFWFYRRGLSQDILDNGTLTELDPFSFLYSQITVSTEC